MSYETKALLIGLLGYIKKADSLKEVYDYVAKMANAEALSIEPYESEDKEPTVSNWQKIFVEDGAKTLAMRG